MTAGKGAAVILVLRGDADPALAQNQNVMAKAQSGGEFGGCDAGIAGCHQFLQRPGGPTSQFEVVFASHPDFQKLFRGPIAKIRGVEYFIHR